MSGLITLVILTLLFGTIAAGIYVVGEGAGPRPIDDVRDSGHGIAPIAQTSSWTGFAYSIGRLGHSSVYDSGNDRMVVFGGDSGGLKNDVWVLANATGLAGAPSRTQLSPTGVLPPARRDHTAVYDAANDRMVVFGGWGGGLRGDVWVLENASWLGGTPSWTQLSPSGGPPSARAYHTTVYDSASNRMVVFGGRDGGSAKNDIWLLTNANGLGGTASWTLLSPSGPPPSARVEQTAVYDSASNLMVVFGGYDGGFTNDVWILANANGLGGTPTWTALTPTGGAPTGRYQHTAVYDPASNRMVVFGGCTESACGYNIKNDSWVLTDANGLGGSPSWTELMPAGIAPSTRSGHTAVYDSAFSRMIVFGGYHEGPENDFWALENATGVGGTPSWAAISPVGNPPSVRQGHSSVYDPGSSRIVVFGGYYRNERKNDVWMLEDATGVDGTPSWMTISPVGTSPTARYGHTAVYDSGSNRMVMFGGSDGASLKNDVWVLTNANGLGGTPTWTQFSPSGAPPSARWNHPAVYDPTTDRMIVFGGCITSACALADLRDDVWVLENATGVGGMPSWTALWPSGGPPTARYGHTAVYDPGSNRLVVFGGRDAGNKNDVWLLANANGLGGTPSWTALSPVGGPPAAGYDCTATYDSGSNRMVVFGGWWGAVGYSNDVWVLANATGLGGTPAWVQLSPTGGPPSGRYDHTAVYDPTSDRMVVFGGVVGVNQNLNDVWVLSEAKGGTIPSVPGFVVILAATVLLLTTAERSLPIVIRSSATTARGATPRPGTARGNAEGAMRGARN